MCPISFKLVQPPSKLSELYQFCSNCIYTNGLDCHDTILNILKTIVKSYKKNNNYNNQINV